MKIKRLSPWLLCALLAITDSQLMASVLFIIIVIVTILLLLILCFHWARTHSLLLQQTSRLSQKLGPLNPFFFTYTFPPDYTSFLLFT